MMYNNLSNAEQLFYNFLASHDHPLDGDINYDASKLHYYKCPHGSSTDARYKFHSDGIPAGFFQCWHCNIKANFCSKEKHEVSLESWQVHIKRMEESKRQNELELEKKHEKAAILAEEILSLANEEQATVHNYLRLKHVKNYGLRVLINEDERTQKAECYKGTLLVPCYNENNTLVNIERIYFDKKENKYLKRPLTGAQRSGTFFPIGDTALTKGIIYIAEGYATAATIHEATGQLTFASFNCGNQPQVIKILRKQYPQEQLIIIADDDRWNHQVKLRDSGIKSAKHAITTVKNAIYLLPNFDVLDFTDEKLAQFKPTDINDLFVLLLKKGLERQDALGIIRSQLTCHSILHTEILDKLIKKISPIDFRKLAEIDENEKLKNSHFQIIAVEQILELAKLNKWGICRNHDFIYLFNGAYWSLCDIEELKSFLGTAAEAMGVDKFKARYFNFREYLFKQFIALANLPKPEQRKDAVFINLKNGTFEITPETTHLRAFNRADFITYQLPFEYNPEATAPLFTNYLNKVLPDKQRQDILSEYLGYVFIQPATLKLEKTLLLYGTGANGKSVFYEIVRSLLGEQNTSEYSLQSLTNE